MRQSMEIISKNDRDKVINFFAMLIGKHLKSPNDSIHPERLAIVIENTIFLKSDNRECYNKLVIGKMKLIRATKIQIFNNETGDSEITNYSCKILELREKYFNNLIYQMGEFMHTTVGEYMKENSSESMKINIERIKNTMKVLYNLLSGNDMKLQKLPLLLKLEPIFEKYFSNANTGVNLELANEYQTIL